MLGAPMPMMPPEEEQESSSSADLTMSSQDEEESPSSLLVATSLAKGSILRPRQDGGVTATPIATGMFTATSYDTSSSTGEGDGEADSDAGGSYDRCDDASPQNVNGRRNENDFSGNRNGENPPSKKRRKGASTTRAFGYVIRSFLLDLPLAVIFLVFVLSTSLLYMYDTYVTRVLSAAKWRGNDRLPEEYTYYKRECMKEDLTTLNATDLAISPSLTAEESTRLMMEHGMGLIGSVLTEETTTKLREWVIRRNAELTPAEAIPLDGEYNRWSFAIGANEDPIVAEALREMATHPIVRPTLEKLIGPNPAVAEITAITSAYGAEDQGWHADVKPLGNAVKYARTFTHSYSLFTALQDTTGPMGATEVCPGTHYCANDLEETCYDYGFKVTQSGPWKAGDSLLLNQCAWHRGAAHTGRNAPHRVVFIVTFISRPNYGVDNRQLSHGTYFHIRWDMWGHTLNDLVDAKRWISQPWASIRSFGIWKPKQAQWGWDWPTVTLLRIANDQNGYTAGELVEWVDQFDLFGLPEFLRGPVSQEGYGWEAFIRGTLERFAIFFGSLNLIVLAGYLLLTKVIYFIQYFWSGGKDSGLFRSVLKRLIYSYGTIILVASVIHFQIHGSSWAESLRSGRFLMRPFPDPNSVEIKTAKGPTTIPSVYDVLIGSRFDSRDIGAYNNFLDYHPGNIILSQWVEQTRSVSYNQFPLLQDALVASIVNDIQNGGRFLQQNELGDWVRLSRTEATKFTRMHLMKTSDPLLAALDEEIAFLLAEIRYGPFRVSSMTQQYAQEYLFKWRSSLFHINEVSETDKAPSSRKPSSGLRPNLFALNQVARLKDSMPIPVSRRTIQEEIATSGFMEGDHVEANYNGYGVWFEGRIRGIGDENNDGTPTYEIEYTDGDRNAEAVDNIVLYTRPHEEGDRVSVEVDEDRWCHATIVKVYPSRTFDIRCDEHPALLSNVKIDFIKKLE